MGAGGECYGRVGDNLWKAHGELCFDKGMTLGAPAKPK